METDRKEFTVGLLPVGAASNMSVEVTTTDGMTYSDKSFQLAGLKRNTHYTMNVPCRTKRFMLTVPDGVDTKYGTDTYKDNEFYSVDPATDPTGIFKDWYFYRAELKNTTNTASGDKLKGKNRIQLQVALGFNNSNNGAFVTAPIQCDGTKKVTVSFTAATNRAISANYWIGVTDNGPITSDWLRDINKISPHAEGSIPGSGNVSRTHTFTVTNGQRIMVKVSNTMGEHHLEFADFTYTVE